MNSARARPDNEIHNTFSKRCHTQGTDHSSRQEIIVQVEKKTSNNSSPQCCQHTKSATQFPSLGILRSLRSVPVVLPGCRRQEIRIEKLAKDYSSCPQSFTFLRFCILLQNSPFSLSCKSRHVIGSYFAGVSPSLQVEKHWMRASFLGFRW